VIKTISGGNGGYTYEWFNSSWTLIGTTDTISGLTAGRYYLRVLDVLYGYNCLMTDSLDLSEPDGMSFTQQISKSKDGQYNISCNGGNDGFIKLTITGGSGIYGVTWTGPGGPYTTNNISNLKAGIYTATVTDLNGCNLMPYPIDTLIQPTALNIVATPSMAPDMINNINCFGGTGSITLNVTGGSTTGAYHYDWTTLNGSGIIDRYQKDQLALTKGDYTVMVTDSNLCVSYKDTSLKQPQQLLTALIPTHAWVLML
jgi:hypothetical protein